MNKTLQLETSSGCRRRGTVGVGDLSLRGAIRLGLDLKGGVHMVLEVQTDDALQVETETRSDQFGEQLSLQGIEPTSVFVADPTTIQIEGVPQDRDAEFRQIADDQLSLEYVRQSGAGGKLHVPDARPD